MAPVAPEVVAKTDPIGGGSFTRRPSSEGGSFGRSEGGSFGRRPSATLQAAAGAVGNLFMALSQGQATADDPAKMGARPSPEVQKKLDEIMEGKVVAGVPKCHTLPTGKERFKQMCKEFPKHITHTCLACIIPCLVGALPVIIVGFKARWLKDEWPGYVGKLTDYDHNSYPFVGGGYYAYTHFQGVTNRTGYYIVAVATACIIWNPKDLLKPMLWITVPGYIVHSSWGIIYRFDMRHPGSPGCFALRKVMFAGQAFVLFVTLCICGCRIQRYSGMAGFAVMYMVINFLLIGFMVIYEAMLWDRIKSDGDGFKLIVAAFLNPLIYEGLLTACRLVVRGMPHAHESTLPVLVSIIVASKKMIGRFVITLMQSPTYVLLASIILAFAEFAFISTLVVRDKFMYKCCFKNRNRSQFDVLAAMKKHKLLRVRNAHMETVLEMCFIVIAALIVIITDISVDGYSRQSVGLIIANIFMQIFIEFGVDFACCSWLTVMAKQPMLAVSHLNFKGWTLWVSALMWFSCCFMMDNVVSEVIGNANDHETAFTLFDANIEAETWDRRGGMLNLTGDIFECD